MKRDEEFLSGMWKKVEVLEEDLERERVIQRDREIRKRELLIFMSFAFIVIGVCAASLFISIDTTAVIILFTVMIIVSIKLEFKAMKTIIDVN